jgi:hypothetical protein
MKLRFHRRSHDTPLGAGAGTTSIHVLRDEDDLRRALTRAAEFDQRAADALLSRSAHYRALMTDGGEAEAGDWPADGMPPATSRPQ